MKGLLITLTVIGSAIVLFLCSPFLLLFAFSICTLLLVYRFAAPSSALDRVSYEQIERVSPIKAMVQADPNFSQFLFEDFVRLLYKSVHLARGKKAAVRDKLAPFIASRVFLKMDKLGRPDFVKELSIGLFEIVSIEVGSTWVSCEIFLLSSYTDVNVENETENCRSWYAEERLYLRRKSGLISPGILSMRSLVCPKCNKEIALDGHKCKHCQEQLEPGEEQWQLTDIVTSLREDRDKADRVLPSPRQEIAELPPVIAKDFFPSRRDFLARNRSFKLGEFKELVEMLFIDHQKAWAKLNWEPMAAVQTAAFQDARLFWVNRFRRRKMTPHVDDPFVRAIKVVSIAHDAHFDYITARINASSVEYTTNEKDEIVMGAKDTPVDFREYWTFVRIRRYGVANIEEPRCPACTAPLPGKVKSCPFCKAPIAGLEIDWTLARVDREEDYGCDVGSVSKLSSG